MNNVTTITVAKDYLNFAAAHFTIFSATSRERLHGHGYRVAAELTAAVGSDGLSFNYKIVKDLLLEECERLDEYMLLPQLSPHLSIEEDGDYYRVKHDTDVMLFLKKDTIVLPIRNITIEEMASLLLERVLEHPKLADAPLHSLEVRVSSGTQQWAASRWEAAS
ncbi:MAG: 6-pyruvoyl tetrahydropterin synthase family protein [Lysobacterales bacterium]